MGKKRIKRTVVAGSITNTHPELAAQWDYEANRPFIPEMFTHGSDFKAHWICPDPACGHKWQTTIRSRTSGCGCSKCCAVQTSRTEKHIFYFFKTVLPHIEVTSKDNDAIGKQLDIYIPALGVAFEPGAYRWHSDLKNDYLKHRLCEERGTRLFVAIENCGEHERPEDYPDDWEWFSERLFDSAGHELLIDLETKWAGLLGVNIDRDSVPWDEIERLAVEKSMRKGSDAAFGEVLEKNVILRNAVDDGLISIECVRWYGSKDNLFRVTCRVDAGHEPYMTTLDALRLSAGCRECGRNGVTHARRGNLIKEGRECYDHMGERFISISAMCKAWSTDPSVYRRRLKDGWSVEEALTGKHAHKGGSVCCDHEGNEYSSRREMCRHWGIKESTFVARHYKYGWSLEDSLTRPLRASKAIEDRGCEEVAAYEAAYIDPLGRGYASLSAMCRAWQVNRATYQSRIQADWTVEQALSGFGPNSVEDHLHIKYRSIAAMCDAWGVEDDLYCSRRAAGWSMQEALTGDKESHHCFDHEGKEFASLKYMLDSYQLTYWVFWRRINDGWSLRAALTGIEDGEDEVYGLRRDHLGNTFPSQRDMVDAWGVGLSRYRSRRLRGWSVEEALTGRRV